MKAVAAAFLATAANSRSPRLSASDELEDATASMNFKILGIGELLWDLLPSGPQLGGAPANFVYHARSLGADARLISRVGNDDLGRQAVAKLVELSIPLQSIETHNVRPTGTVSVRVAPDGQPQFQIHENVAWDGIQGNSSGRSAAADCDAVCFGTLVQRTPAGRSAVQSLVAAAPVRALKILDVNLRQQYFSAELIHESLRLVNALKVNDAELRTFAEMFQLHGDERSQMQRLAETYGLQLVACTRGANGSLLLADGQWSEDPGRKVQVIDTIGAGDSFTAAMALGWLADWELDEINEKANQVASFVASCPGGTPKLPDNLRAAFTDPSS